MHYKSFFKYLAVEKVANDIVMHFKISLRVGFQTRSKIRLRIWRLFNSFTSLSTRKKAQKIVFNGVEGVIKT